MYHAPMEPPYYGTVTEPIYYYNNEEKFPSSKDKVGYYHDTEDKFPSTKDQLALWIEPT